MLQHLGALSHPPREGFDVPHRVLNAEEMTLDDEQAAMITDLGRAMNVFPVHPRYDDELCC